MKPYVIALSHQKGGVAKTTSVSALGASLAEQGRKILVIDLDPSANLTAGFGLNPLKMQKSMADILLGKDTIPMVYRSTSLPGLDIVPSNPDMNTAAQLLQIRPQYENILTESIQHDEISTYDFIIFDCTPSMGPLTVNALTAANLAIIPTQCEYYALQALNGIFKIVQRVRAKFNPELYFRLLITMFDLRGKLHTQILEKLQHHYSTALLETKIGFDSKLRASQVEGIPITVFAPNTRAAQQYRTLASEIAAYVE